MQVHATDNASWRVRFARSVSASKAFRISVLYLYGRGWGYRCAETHLPEKLPRLRVITLLACLLKPVSVTLSLLLNSLIRVVGVR